MISTGRASLKGIFDLSGRVALITGAAGGFGEAIALGFAEFGCDIVATDVNFDGARSTASGVEKMGRKAAAYKVDVGKPADIQKAVDAVVEDFGRIDILVNSAAVSPHEPAETSALETWNESIDINLRGTFLCCQAAARVMLEKGKGSIINFSSISGHVGFPRGVAIYSASKGGVDALTRQLAIEWSKRGIRVNSLAPCQFMTPGLEAVLRDPQFDPEKLMQTWKDNIPVGRVGEAWEMVGPALFLASDASSMVTGVCLPVDGGYLAR